jgi:hypothetical protein
MWNRDNDVTKEAIFGCKCDMYKAYNHIIKVVKSCTRQNNVLNDFPKTSFDFYQFTNTDLFFENDDERYISLEKWAKQVFEGIGRKYGNKLKNESIVSCIIYEKEFDSIQKLMLNDVKYLILELQRKKHKVLIN